MASAGQRGELGGWREGGGRYWDGGVWRGKGHESSVNFALRYVPSPSRTPRKRKTQRESICRFYFYIVVRWFRAFYPFFFLANGAVLSPRVDAAWEEDFRCNEKKFFITFNPHRSFRRA